MSRLGVLSAVSAILLSASGAPPVAAASPPAAAQSSVVAAKIPQPTVKRGTRLAPAASAIRQSISSRVAPALAAQSAVSHRSDVLANFDGVGSLDSAITNFGAEFEPPDQGLCAGNGFVVEMVNSAFRIYDTHGNTLAGPTNVNAPFQDGFAQFTSDPRCQYDAATNTWFAVILFINDTSDGSRLEIAYNTSGDPTTPWSVFKIDTTNAKAPATHGCPCFGDQPTLGIDAYNLYSSTNEFSILGPQFNGAQIYAISKADLVSHSAKVHFVHYRDLMIDGALAASIQPAMTNGPAAAEYFLSSLDPNGTGDNRIAVWALTRVNKVSTGGTPRLSSVIIGSEAYVSPPNAAQKGSASLLNTGDDRMQQTQFINGEVWGTLDTQVQIAGDVAPRAGVAWFRVKPQLSGSKIGSASLSGQGYVASPENNVMYGAIEADSHGRAAIVFTLVGEDRFASAAYAVLSTDGSAFGHPVVAARGTGPYDAKATRWGDYSWVSFDPATDSVWMATEYIPAASSQTTDGRRNWGTRVINLALD